MSKLNVGDVKVFKFVTGEEVIATVTGLVHTSVEIDECLAIIMQINQQTGRPQPALLPWGHSTKDSKRIPLSHVLYYGEPVDNLLEHYNETFGKIITPSNGIVISE
jgi:hypothetical protein